MRPLVTVYLRGSNVIVVPSVERDGTYHDVSPVFVVPPVPEDVQLAIAQSRQDAGRSGVREPGSRWVVLQRLHIRELASFFVDVAACKVREGDGGSAMVLGHRPAPDRRGFEPDGSMVVTEPDRVGKVVLALLRKAPRFPAR